MKLFILLLLYLVPKSLADVCSTESCNEWSKDPNTINVHLVCHTHDDLGWIKTVDQYYWGSKQWKVPVGVQYILNTVIAELEKDPRRKFSWAETGFLWRWMNSHSDFDRHHFAKLVKKGQMEIIGGGWVQNDEAAAHYIDIVDQMGFGLRKLNATFGRCAVPKIAWQIDPFGHSREQANLFAMMGFDALFFSRFHYLEKARRLSERSLEFVWSGSDDLKTNIFTGAFYGDSYGPPRGFCFDALCDDEPIMDSIDMEEYNVDERVQSFIDYVKLQALFQRTKHVMLLMGSDFQYTNANTWYTNLDKLIEHVNKKENETKVRVFYSTPGCYYNGVKESGPQLPKKSDDFFPYASSAHSYWTGYFTSRPAFKGFIRQSTGFMQLVKQLDALAMLDEMDNADLDVLRSAMALVQHHDAVTGTAKENVTRDYIKRLSKGWIEGEIVINDALKKLAKRLRLENENQVLCRKINETICEATSTMREFAVTVFNAHSQPQETSVMIPYYQQYATVTDAHGQQVEAQLLKTFNTTVTSPNMAPYQLFVPVTVPALGFTTVHVKNTRHSDAVSSKKEKLMQEIRRAARSQKPIRISNGLIELSFDKSGLLSSYKNLKTGLQKPLKQEFFYYEGHGGWPYMDQASGAYVFRPNNTEPNQLRTPIIFDIQEGPIVNEVRQMVTPWIWQTIRLHKNKEYVEFEWTVGPIPKELPHPVTKEVITRYSTDIASQGVFFTDANGRQMMTRKRNYSPSFTYNDTEPVSGNYFPINSRIYLKDNEAQMTILTDRSQGGTSMHDGELEIMLHRRSFFDDGWGVSEPLDEPGEMGAGLVVRGRHWLLISPPAQAASLHRPLALELLYAPVLTFAPISIQPRNLITEFSGLARPLPQDVHLLTLEQWTGRDVLLRLEHIYQSNEDERLASPVTVDLQNLFTTFEVTSMKELLLGANIYKPSDEDNATRNRGNMLGSAPGTESFTVQLTPMEIKTFKLSVKAK